MASSYTGEIAVYGTPQAAFHALTGGFGDWWTPSSSPIGAAGDIVTFRFDPTYWTMRVSELLPDRLVELECIGAHHVHDGLPATIEKEWEGTRLRWEIQPDEDGAKIRFTHDGLNPSLECYEVCKQGWDHFFMSSLKEYLDKQKQ